MWPKGFMPSVLSTNQIFLGSLVNEFPCIISMLCHWVEFAGCHRLSSFFRPSLCQRSSWASFLLANIHFNGGIIGKYHATFWGPPWFLSSSPPSFLRLYRGVPHSGHSINSACSPWNRMQLCLHAWIFSTINQKGKIVCLVSYVVSDMWFPFGSMSRSRSSNCFEALVSPMMGCL